MNEDFLVAPNLQEGFDSAQAVDGDSVSIGKQDIFGLLGPNTAGKTTTLKILSTVQPPDSGDVTIGGHSAPIDNLALFGKIGDLRGAVAKSTASESSAAVGLSPSIARVDSRHRSVTRT